MTGFGEDTYEDDNIKINVSIKSLNSKNLDVKIKSNYTIDSDELMIKNLLGRKLKRGKIDCKISIEEKNEKAKYKINENVFLAYYEQLKNIGLGLNKDINKLDFYGTILRLPQTIEPIETEDNSYLELILKTTQKAIDNLINFRQQEGEATAEVLNQYLDKISDYLSKVPQYENERIETVKKRLVHALESAEIKVNNERFEAELIFYLEKYDIQEEKTRLKNHIKYFKQTMNEDFTGKKLGFIAQEMGREINTLGSKANHSEIQKLVVQMKDELEKIKEQVLNIL